jgi:hypothetical protein
MASAEEKWKDELKDQQVMGPRGKVERRVERSTTLFLW